jgi:hypothetical protein
MANKENALKINKVRVVGVLEEVELKRDVSRGNNKNYIAGNIVVKSELKGEEQLTEFTLFAFQLTREGKENSFYKTYDGLEDRTGERVAIDGEIEENRFYSNNNDALISQSRNRAKFINKPTREEEDEATFIFGGYVVKPINERLNKNEEVIHYEITLGQADYSGTKPIYITFAVDRDNTKAVKFMENEYEVGETVRVDGNFEVTHEQNEVVKENAFGKDKVKVYDNYFKIYRVTGGSAPLEKGSYDEDYILDLAQSYKDIGQDLKAKSESQNESSQPKSKRKTKSKLENML